MGYLGRRIGLSQDKAGPSSPAGADGAVGGGILDLFANGYFQRQGNIYNAPGIYVPQGLTASGGVISDYTEPGGNIYRAHVFTSSGTFNVSAIGDYPATVEYLVVAGGGGGGNAHSTNATGGGGAGGLRSSHPDTPSPMKGTAYPISTTNPYTVTIGAGGVAYREHPTFGYSRKGSNSEFYPTPVGSGHPTGIFAHGGGAGAAHEYTPDPEMNGGSGGGGDTYDPPQPEAGGSTTSGTGHGPTVQGFAGGSSQFGSPGYGGGGGGGAGEAGNTDGHGYGGTGLRIRIAGPPTVNGIGGPGPSSTYQWFAGGGGGEYSPGTGTPGRPGGFGGGGDASTRNAVTVRGMSGTGGGGGATKNNPSTHSNILGHGGSGIVIVRYQIGSTPTQKATGGSISHYGGKTIHTFTSSGTFATTSDWSAADVEYVVIGGGGSGGGVGTGPHYNDGGGGGGAGAYRTGTTPIGAHPVSTTIQIGAGGGGTIQTSDGTPSYFGTPITSPGGGGGGYGGEAPPAPNKTGRNGGSAGGGVYSNGGGTGSGDTFPGTIGSTPANGWGNDGGDGDSSYQQGGGGGGAGGLGADASHPAAGNGGIGIQLPTTFRDPASSVGAPGPTSPSVTGADTSGKYYVAGGGGGGLGNPAGDTVGTGGAGGGGDGGDNNAPPLHPGEPALANTGSGGGGSGNVGTPQSGNTGGSGGSGIVLIAYPT
jgi:hypothetical protein